MGDLLQFPEGGRKPVAPEISVMYCSACGEERRWHVAAADPGPCKCGGHVFTNDPGLGVGAAMHVQVWSPIPGIEVVSPGPTLIPPRGGNESA